jgi:hypothetical protein
MQYLYHHGIFAFAIKQNNIFKIFDSLLIYHEIHVFKIINTPPNSLKNSNASPKVKTTEEGIGAHSLPCNISGVKGEC